MPDPITIGTALVKAATADSPGSGNETTSLLKRLLLPPVDEFAEALRRSVAYRTRNFGRIVDKAERKSHNHRNSGLVSQRVAYVLLEEGSLCDDELMAEYLGGLLAGSRSADGRDDRAVAWCQIVNSMSWLQVRAHFILYREWAARLHGLISLQLGMGTVRDRCQMDLELNEFTSILINATDINPDDSIQDSILGLAWLGLIEDQYATGHRSSHILVRDSPFEELIRVQPTVRGLELYGWAQGLPGLSMDDFVTKATVFDTEPIVARPTNVVFLKLSESEAVQPQ